MEHMNLKCFLEEYFKSGKYVCVSARTGQRLCSNSNTHEYVEKFYDREVHGLWLDSVVINKAAYPVMKIWISDYNNK